MFRKFRISNRLLNKYFPKIDVGCNCRKWVRFPPLMRYCPTFSRGPSIDLIFHPRQFAVSINFYQEKNQHSRRWVIFIFFLFYCAQNFNLDIDESSSDDLLNTCRICRDETVRECLISPCHCAGTLGKCHLQCLEEWLSKANKSSCEICGHRYHTARIPRSFKEVSQSKSDIYRDARRVHVYVEGQT